MKEHQLMNYLLECWGLSKHYAQEAILDKIDLAIPKGVILSLVGPSGCGKTTLLRCIAGLERPTRGSIFIEGEEVTSKSAHSRPVVMMFQEPLLFPHLTIMENIIFGLKTRGLNKRERNEAGLLMLKKIQMEPFANRYPYECSGGQKQRVSLARALVLRPKLLLLDEPFSSLDPELREEMRQWVKEQLKEEGITSLFVTHDKEEAMYMGDQVAVMEKGRIRQIGDPWDVYLNPNDPFVARFFGDGLLLDDRLFISAHYLRIYPTPALIPGQWSAYRGHVIEQWIKHGQIFCRIELAEQQQTVALPVNNLQEAKEVWVAFDPKHAVLM
jgi:ABC-type Fe3+/spermidine/putrescine transport system ATPase subunit